MLALAAGHGGVSAMKGSRELKARMCSRFWSLWAWVQISSEAIYSRNLMQISLLGKFMLFHLFCRRKKPALITLLKRGRSRELCSDAPPRDTTYVSW